MDIDWTNFDRIPIHEMTPFHISGEGNWWKDVSEHEDRRIHAYLQRYFPSIGEYDEGKNYNFRLVVVCSYIDLIKDGTPVSVEELLPYVYGFYASASEASYYEEVDEEEWIHLSAERREEEASSYADYNLEGWEIDNDIREILEELDMTYVVENDEKDIIIDGRKSYLDVATIKNSPQKKLFEDCFDDVVIELSSLDDSDVEFVYHEDNTGNYYNRGYEDYFYSNIPEEDNIVYYNETIKEGVTLYEYSENTNYKEYHRLVKAYKEVRRYDDVPHISKILDIFMNLTEEEALSEYLESHFERGDLDFDDETTFDDLESMFYDEFHYSTRNNEAHFIEILNEMKLVFLIDGNANVKVYGQNCLVNAVKLMNSPQKTLFEDAFTNIYDDTINGEVVILAD